MIWIHNKFDLIYRANQDLVEQAFMPTLKTLFNAPASSPLADVNVTNVAELLVQLTSNKLMIENHSKSMDMRVGVGIYCTH